MRPTSIGPGDPGCLDRLVMQGLPINRVKLDVGVSLDDVDGPASCRRDVFLRVGAEDADGDLKKVDSKIFVLAGVAKRAGRLTPD
jgi:hypothetical protein